MKSKFILVFILLFSLISCEETDNTELNLDEEIISISYGTSFGECMGYCKRKIEIEGTVVKYIVSSWSVDDNYPDIEIKGTISEQDWNSITEKIDFIVFRNLEEVIGCPDCADGGAEWIKVDTRKLSHKITCEYNNPPEAVQDYIQELSELFAEYQAKIY